MDAEADELFYQCSDAHIRLANEQLADLSRGKVSSSFMYSVARFNAWLAACRADSADDLRSGKSECIEYFVAQYKAMLNENLDDYIRHFDKYMRTEGNDA